MILILLQIAVTVGIAFGLVRWRAAVSRRNAETWDSLISRLRPDWRDNENSNHSLWKRTLRSTPDDAWQRIEGPNGLWAMFENARVMMALADYADRNNSGVDRLLLETMRSDAMQIRVCVLSAMVQYAFTQANEGVRVNAFRAASTYTSMAARTTELLQAHAAGMVPEFVAAM
jgi:hypothetical protein